ncbi:cytidylate kinase-like family protein [Methylomagnum sp.]
MSCTDPHSFLQALLAKEQAEDYVLRKPPKAHTPLVVTLSRDYGAGGETIAQTLAECLGLAVYDHEIVELAAKKAKVEAFKFDAQEEDDSPGISTFLYSVLTGTAGELHTYRRALYEALLEMSHNDCLLMGRGAHLILSNKKVFRVRVVGSKVVCAKRVAEDTGLSLLQAERLVYEVNNKRHKLIDNLFRDNFEHCSLEFAKNFDLVINTDHIAAEQAVPIILLAMQQAGFDLRQPAPPA